MAEIQKTIVIAVIKDSEGNVLLDKRIDPNIPNADGRWEFPGGHIEFGERAEDAVVREAKEETGLEVKVVRLLPKVFQNMWDMANGDKFHTVLISYECEVIGGKLHTKNFDKKISELKFIKPEEITQYNLLPQTKEILDLLTPNI